jgi:hypothetical protein
MLFLELRSRFQRLIASCRYNGGNGDNGDDDDDDNDSTDHCVNDCVDDSSDDRANVDRIINCVANIR